MTEISRIIFQVQNDLNIVELELLLKEVKAQIKHIEQEKEIR